MSEEAYEEIFIEEQSEEDVEALPCPPCEPEAEPGPTKDELLSKISELEALLSSQTEKYEAKRAERRELCRLFPDADPDALPDEVLRQNEAGVPLAAAYALYERIRQSEISAAKNANAVNSTSINPSLSGGEEDYFTADEVKNMTQRQVRENFSSIKRSMKHWAKKK